MEDYIDLELRCESFECPYADGTRSIKLSINNTPAQDILDQIGKEHVFEWVKQKASIDEIGDLAIGITEKNNE